MKEEMNATQNKKKYEINGMVDGRGMFICSDVRVIT